MAIYDCFTFHDELKILELRLKLLDKYVDYFVISELPVTFRGLPRPSIFNDNKELFSDFAQKIIYVTSDYVPEDTGDGDWSIEYWQRNCIMKGLVNCKPDDIVMISDVDEIPNPFIFENLKKLYVYPDFRRNGVRKFLSFLANNNRKNMAKLFKKSKLLDVLEFSPVACNQRLFYYFLNCESYGKWNGTVILKYKYMQIPQNIRNLRGKVPIIPNGGWHFSFIGGIDKIKTKLKDARNDERKEVIDAAKRHESDDKFIIECMEKGKDIFGRKGKQYRFRFIPEKDIGIFVLEEILPDYREYIYYPK